MQSDKLKNLPRSPGVYFHKDKAGEIIYVGKAAVLKNRVKQYFQNQRDMDIKTKALVAEIDDTDWIETESEIDALFLEAEMIKRYMPRFNILLRDDKSLIFVRIDMKNEWPFVSFTRNPIDDGAEYFGPYYNGFAVKKALRHLRKVFPYYLKTPKEKSKPDLDSHLGLNPINMTSNEYKANLRKLFSYIKGNRKSITKELEIEMKNAASVYDFEKAAMLRNKIRNLGELQQRIMFGDKEFLDISKDLALRDLTDLLNLSAIPVRIEGYDISHMGGTNVVASMVVFRNGASDRGEYRKFKTKIEHNDDFFNMNETITRRLSENNLKSWGQPNLILIDGGKGQLDAALKARDALSKQKIPFIGLAKRDEQIIVKHQTLGINEVKLKELNGNIETSQDFITINLPNSSHIIKLLQRIRDESHRFAVSYHTVLKRAKQTSSALDEIPGIGPKTRSNLIKKFGSVRGLKSVSETEIAKVVGKAKAKLVFNYMQGL
ncbi:excinuclease ABC subunit C [Candidatus Saccharibacteria bacterium HGW-Saccharibacteria-1]|jgi:excinuclease ABC subunit C|nr:MAG: excinuclease ABC subunit C [Candidatus Saccharibacteria bacterium HGW-Saccharibacteria-1]